MSKFARSVASALSFAHLTGFGSASSKGSRAEDDDEDKKKSRRAEDDRDDDDDDDKKGSRADGDDPDAEDGDDDKKKSRRASSDDHDDDDDEEDKPKSKKAKRAKADGDDPDAEDDDDEDEMRGSSAASKARGRERARVATILSSKHAAKNLPMALNLACNTTLTRKQVLAVLRDTPAAHTAAPTNGHRAGRNPNLGTDRADSPSRSATVASRWDRAMTKVRGSK